MALVAVNALLKTLKGRERILVALALCDYLTAAQLTRLLYAASSYSYVRKELNALVANEYVVALSGRLASLPTLYTLTGKGYSAVAAVGSGDTKRVRPTEERDKAQNVFFVKHTIAVSDVVIGALLLSQSHPDIVLTRLYRTLPQTETVCGDYPAWGKDAGDLH
jgi:Replication-relaxation